MIKSNILTRAALLSVLAVGALTATGCGGAKTNGDTLDTTPAAGPVVVGVDQNGSAAEVSGLAASGDPAQPTAADVAYATTATAVTVLSGAAPLTGTDSYIGVADYGNGTANTTAVPAGTNVLFRAYIVNGQNSGSRTYIPIKSVVLTSADPEAAAAGFTPKPLALAFRFDNTAAGPLASATFATATFPLPFTSNGAHTFSVTVTDNSGQSSRTDFTTLVVAAGNIVVSLNTIDTGTKDATGAEVIYTLLPGDTVTLAGATTQTATADANGNVQFFATPGAYTLTVTTAATTTTPSATYTQALDLSAQAPGTTYAQVKKRVGAVKIHKAIKAHREQTLR